LILFVEIFEAADKTTNLTWEFFACTQREFFWRTTRHTDELVRPPRGDQSLPSFEWEARCRSGLLAGLAYVVPLDVLLLRFSRETTLAASPRSRLENIRIDLAERLGVDVRCRGRPRKL
jgi:hypothetical protein